MFSRRSCSLFPMLPAEPCLTPDRPKASERRRTAASPRAPSGAWLCHPATFCLRQKGWKRTPVPHLTTVGPMSSQDTLAAPGRGAMSCPARGWVWCASRGRHPLRPGSRGMAESSQAAPRLMLYHRTPSVRSMRPVWSYHRTRDIVAYLIISLSSPLHKCDSIRADVMKNQALGLMV